MSKYYPRIDVEAFEKKRETLLAKALEVCKIKGVYFIADVTAYLGISKNHFYELFPVGSDNYEKINIALTENKVIKKVGMRVNWGSVENDNPATQIALYKLLATKDERRLLATQFIELPSEEENDNSDISEAELDEQIKAFEALTNGQDTETSIS